MKTHYQGIDFLRGLGVFFVIILHTAFYYFDGIYDIDLDNPSLIITLIGFLLMFAGMFAMLSGFSYTIQYLRQDSPQSRQSRLKQMAVSGLLLLVVAYLYFIFTGPGIIHFESRSMDESLFVSFIHTGRFQSVTLDRWFYVDSLVMLSINILLLSLFFKVMGSRLFRSGSSVIVLIFAILFMGLSYVRIPLYNIYLDARDQGQYSIVFLLNWLVGKNNPIMPFFAFGLFGSWMAIVIKEKEIKGLRMQSLIVALSFLVIGILGYILAPETMLERAIDPTWYFIMTIQIGLFMLMILGAVSIFDYGKKPFGSEGSFIKRFGVAGLTPFFFESIISALVFLMISWVIPIRFDIPGAILYGITLAVLWGLFLSWWEMKQYRYGMEWMIGKILSKKGHSTKFDKLNGIQS